VGKISIARDRNPVKSSDLTLKIGKNAMGKQSDRNREYMMDMWGTNQLATDYGSLNNFKKQVISEIMNDDYSQKKHNLSAQSELHQKIRNDDDYDDWEYGTEPVYGSKS